VTKLKEKPFALIGVNVNRHTPESLKAVMTSEKLNWRSFADEGEIAAKWNSPPTPTFYVLDHTGVIRHKWIGHPGETTIDAALEKLIHAAQSDD
jgi:hypothetical protein